MKSFRYVGQKVLAGVRMHSPTLNFSNQLGTELAKGLKISIVLDLNNFLRWIILEGAFRLHCERE